MVTDGHRYNTSGGVGDRANEENLESRLEAIPGRPSADHGEGCWRPLLEDPTQHQAAPGIQTTTVKHTSKQQQCQLFNLHRKVC